MSGGKGNLKKRILAKEPNERSKQSMDSKGKAGPGGRVNLWEVLQDWCYLKKKEKGVGSRGRTLLFQPTGFLSTLKLNTKIPLNGAVKDKCDHKLLLLVTH